ncbi:single-stranded DNA-binding protein [Burkholderiaceae bacterium FT117]|uniref:uracil-DNA glycosylase family protein n=1 Tax=Zeimonas sediminis TaxID=2944268 RepID=UPI002342CE49|nr:uracil-DNA glycosylase family protein [Zeimonas sediminis]MCM5571501.1 single-stranded DNA-binding protein [Zeimonas sediminis]
MSRACSVSVSTPAPCASAPASGAPSSTADRLVEAALALRAEVDAMRFSAPVNHVYDPLDYAWAGHEAYLRRYGDGRRRVVFLGMNPGPFGMMQTGVPFGEVAAVRDWMGIEAPIARPAAEHPKRPIEGFGCQRSEVSGRRLWGWAAERFGSAERFFADCFVLNYCPLVFLEESGRNLTPDKLPAAELAPLLRACDAHLRAALAALRPDWLIGIGGWAMKRAGAALADAPVDTDAGNGPPAPAHPPRIDTILHPSPASPAANRGWAPAVDRRLGELGVFG